MHLAAMSASAGHSAVRIPPYVLHSFLIPLFIQNLFSMADRSSFPVLSLSDYFPRRRVHHDPHHLHSTHLFRMRIVFTRRVLPTFSPSLSTFMYSSTSSCID